MSLLSASIKRIGQKQPRKGGDTIFPIICQLGLSVAMDLFVLRLNVPVNNFSVMSGRSHRFLGN